MEEANVKMQDNYTALYEYICDDPVYSLKPGKVIAKAKKVHFSQWLEHSKQFDTFWKAVVARIDDNLLQIP